MSASAGPGSLDPIVGDLRRSGLVALLVHALENRGLIELIRDELHAH